MSDSQTYKELQNQLNKFISRLDELEIENKFLKEQQLSTQCQLIQNVKTIDAKFQRIYRKYLRCLYQFGQQQSCLVQLLNQYHRVIDQNCINVPKMNLKTFMEKYGVVYEGNKIINDSQMDEIINQKLKQESDEIQALFFPTKLLRNDCLNESDSIYQQFHDSNNGNPLSFQSSSSIRYKMPGSFHVNSDPITDRSDEVTINYLNTQKYLEKLSIDCLNDQTISYPKTFKVDKLLQQSNRDLSSQLQTDRNKRQKSECNRVEFRQDSKYEQNQISPNKQLNQSINEDRFRRIDSETSVTQRRRSRAERLKQLD